MSFGSYYSLADFGLFMLAMLAGVVAWCYGAWQEVGW